MGGVLLAIMILALALNPPGGSHPSLTPTVMPARGALMQTGDHPEWRHFLIHAATRRADELNRLRELPNTPVRTEHLKDARKVAGLPADRSDADPGDETGSITEVPGVNLPVEIGETSSTELRVTRSDEKPRVIKKPERVKPTAENRQKPVRRAHRTKAPAKTGPAAQFNLFETMFSGQRLQQGVSDGAQDVQPATARAEQN